jgi:hypothetical protein
MTYIGFLAMKPLLVLLKARHRRMLEWLAAHHQQSMGRVIRDLIEHAHETESVVEASGVARAKGAATGESET